MEEVLRPGRMYWAEDGTKKLRSATLDGEDLRDAAWGAKTRVFGKVADLLCVLGCGWLVGGFVGCCLLPVVVVVVVVVVVAAASAVPFSVSVSFSGVFFW